MKALNMPQLQNLVLADRESTPVNHTFVPAGIQGNVATLVESTGTPAADSKLTLGWATTTNGRRKSTMRFTFPIVQNETINGIVMPKVVRSSYVEVSFSFDPTSTEQERKNVVGMTQAALLPGAVLVNDTVVKLQGVY